MSTPPTPDGPRPPAGDWAARDAAVVWHGFTQMATYPDNAPVTVDRAEGRELIDVEGRRYFDAISSLWVTTLGHHVPELDAAVIDQLGRVAHSTLLGNGNRAAVEFAEALADVVPVDDPHVLFASDGAVAVEQALKIAFQYWVNRGEPGHTAFLALGDAYHGDTVGALSLGDSGFGTALFDPLRFPVLRTPGYAAPDWADKAVAVVEAHAGELAAVVIEPLVQGASGMLVADPEDLARLGEACRRLDVLLICDEVATGFGRTGRLFASEWAGADFRPDLLCLGKGITGGYLPLSATVASGRVFAAFDGPDLGERTFYHGHSYSGNAIACRGGAPPPRAPGRVGRAGQRAPDRRPVGHAPRGRGDPPGCRGGAPAGPDGGDRAGAAVGRRAVGPPGVRRGGRPRGAAAAPRRRRGADAATDHHRRGDRTGGRGAGGVARRGVGRGRRVSGSPPPPASPDGSAWRSWVEASCRVVDAAGQWRRPRTFDARGPVGHLDAPAGSRPGGEVVSFASNDYLGLSTHPAVVGAAHEALDRWGAGSGASRLVTGSRPVHAELEEALARWKGCERAVLLPTGFAANLSVLEVFAAEGAHLFSDELNHASIIDGCRAARAGVTVYRHGDLDQLDALLGTVPGRPVVVSDTVFSMDGDAADLDGLVDLARRHGALLVLDEAHAVLGPELTVDGSGALDAGVDILRVGTLSKTLGALGGFVAGPARFVELLENRARPYIFTTAPTPADAAAGLAALGVVRSAEGDELRSRLGGHVARVSAALGRTYQPSPIVPIVIGEEERTVAASADLLDRGLWVPAIRPPTVPPGTSRLRVTVSAAHTDDQVERLVAVLTSLGLAEPGGGAVAGTARATAGAAGAAGRPGGAVVAP